MSEDPAKGSWRAVGVRGALALWSGYLCCLAGFEWSRAWEFSPLKFRPVAAILASIAFTLCLTLHQRPQMRRSPWAVASLVWIGLVFWPTFGNRSLWPTSVAVLLLLGAFYQAGRPSGSKTALSSARAVPRGPCVEITWRGFAALFAAAVPGEGERFTRTVLADAHSIVVGCQGRRIKGSDLNGVYRFPDELSLTRCLERLSQYHQQTSEVLAAAQAPVLELIVQRP